MPEIGRAIADAVKTDLDAQSFSLTPTITRVPNPRADLAAISGLTIFVSDETKDYTRTARQGSQLDVVIVVAIFQQAENTLAAQNPLADFAQEVEDRLGGTEDNKAPRMAGAKYLSHRSIKPENVQGQEWPAFTRLLRITYRAYN